MSHRATSWAILQRGLKPAVRVVLWYLADHHNPVEGCFPRQDTLANECEMSVRSVRTHLDALEAAGLIRRVKADDNGRRRRSDRYILGFEDDFAAVANREAAADEPAGLNAMRCEMAECAATDAPADAHPNTGNSAGEAAAKSADTGKSGAETPANPGEKHRQNLPPNLVKEPVREPCVGGVSAAHIEKLLSEFWDAYPRPRDRATCRRWFEELAGRGVDLGSIVAAAKRYAAENAGNKPMYLAYADNWLRDRRWEDFAGKSDARSVCPDDAMRDVADFWAEKIKRGKYVPSNAISGQLAGVMLSLGLVEEGELRRVGVPV